MSTSTKTPFYQPAPLGLSAFLRPSFVMLSKIRQYQSANAVMINAKVFARCVDITLKRIDNQL